MAKDVLHGHKGLTSNPGTLAFRNMLLSLDRPLADGMSFHLFF